ncbi:YbaB/EbfC family nucleoid-associated protein [Actinokineospora cianjurensis]|uniref:YbaB/EbfC DNA-binding family protein n=1 Tax=Actinokineospora cianjurensis TaxID=585224 RepID=A0A421AWY4_9PSEU|nr:YbaB/EbfC family nucleoid-associated protein [Actinokineospora cianjurensis]RLK54336.1 YbaB/EbfC DNA-binding family protein [Actinokineospora cianjurensis]
MSTPLHNELATALAELREQQEKIATAVDAVANATTTVAAEDRMVEATVDGQGKLVELKFNGRRWRDLAPKELASRLVEVIGKAQEQAASASAAVFAGVMPGGAAPSVVDFSDPAALNAEIAAMFDAAVKEWR